MKTRDLTIAARDGLALAATLFEPPSGVRATVLVCSGTGIPRGFYASFASALARAGLLTMTFDYRGVGGSRPPSLVGFEANKIDWGRLDMSGAFDALAARAPDRPHTVLGHSVGGQLIGLMDQADEIDAVISVASSFGYWGAMPAPYRYFVASLWYLAFPLATSVFGYMPAKRMGLGEDLPAGVARQWADWGRRATYFTEELRDEPGFARVRAPWLALTFEDDPIATPANAEPLHALYPHAELELRRLSPRAEGFAEIGHLGLFSRRRARLWPRVIQWLGERTPGPRRRFGTSCVRSADAKEQLTANLVCGPQGGLKAS